MIVIRGGVRKNRLRKLGYFTFRVRDFKRHFSTYSFYGVSFSTVIHVKRKYLSTNILGVKNEKKKKNVKGGLDYNVFLFF